MVNGSIMGACFSAASRTVLLVLLAIGCASPRGGSPASDGAAGSSASPAGDAGPGTAVPVPPDGGPPPGADAPAARPDAPATIPVPPGHHRLSINLMGPGTVAVEPGIGRCDSSCSFDVPMGAAVDLSAATAQSAIPSANIFVGWSDACTGQAACRVTMNADRAVTARFHQLIPWEQPALGSVAVVGDTLFVAGSFTGSQTLSGLALSSRGMRDGWLLRCDLAGKVLSAKTLGGPADDYLGNIRRLPNGDLFVIGSAGSADVLYDGKSVGVTGKFAALLGPAGELRQAFPVPETFYFDLDGAGNLVTTEFKEAGKGGSLVKRDTSGKVLWSKPPMAGEFGYTYPGPSVDPLGNIVVFHTLETPTPVVGGFQPENGRSLLFKLTPDGELLWVIQVGSYGGGSASVVRFDGAADLYLGFDFVGPLKLDGKTIATSVDGGADIGVAKLSRTDGALLWFKSFASILPDRSGGLVFDALDRLVAIGVFATRVTIGAQTFPASTLAIRLDPATGNVIDATDMGRPMQTLVKLPMGDFIYLSATNLSTQMGRLSLP
jgi:hypothetical protein